MSALPNFPQFEIDSDIASVGVKWPKWVLRFENFLVAYNTTNDARKKALLLHFAGPTVHDIFETLATAAATAGTEQYKATLEALNTYFLQKRMWNLRSTNSENQNKNLVRISTRTTLC